MKTKRSNSCGLTALTYALVLLMGDVVAQGSNSKESCIANLLGDGHCDRSQNIEICGYDGGDCCQCTCTSGPKYACRSNDFACMDPGASCTEDVDVTPSRESELSMESTSTSSCVPGFFADGDCDVFNNVEECGYDEGDCCDCTCVSTDTFTCGDESHGGFQCLDPSAPCVDDDDDEISTLESSASNCVAEFFADGDCDLSNNNEFCGYDGGDCCECTCVSTDAFTCGDESDGGFACIDPDASCVDDDDITTNPSAEDTSYYGSTTTELDCIPDFFADGLCDPINNDEACGYDGGDCCECTCQSTDLFDCGDDSFGGFDCIDPGAACVDDDDDIISLTSESSTYTESTTGIICVPDFLSDGLCDEGNNNEECGYDGGDCCVCTCVDTPEFSCGDGGFDCRDPSAPCIDDDATTTTSTYYTTTSTISCVPNFFGDGDCDPGNNNKECDYDGGDCCECTCVSTPTFTCGDDSDGGFDCVDPRVPCFDQDDDLTSPESTSSICTPLYASDGACDQVNNNEDCGYDGGDCCECTCVSTSDFTCGDGGGFDCIDPDASCEEELVEAGTKTTIGVSTNTYDTRPGEDFGGVGCGEDGCAPELTRDGNVGLESRWACAQKLNPEGGLCEIKFVFEDPQDIMEVQVAFFKGDERSRTLQGMINGEIIGEFDSNPETPFTAFGIQSVGVETIKFTTLGLTENDWISLFEVRFMVQP